MSRKKLRNRIERRASQHGLDPPTSLIEQLETYYLELAKWNEKINLTSLTLNGEGSDAAVDRLLIEPLVAVRYLPIQCLSLVDLGSGGGSPAIPMKLARPEISLTMVEVKVRKSAFLRQVSRQLQLERASVETSRFQELLSRPHFHESFDAASVRAVRVDQTVWLGIQAFLRPGGTVLHFSSDRVVSTVPPPLALAEIVALGDGSSRLAVLRKEFVGRRFT